MPRRGSRLGGCGAAMSPAFIDQGTKKTHFRKVRFLNGAGDRVRTDNLDLGKVALCQLSYTRKKIIPWIMVNQFAMSSSKIDFFLELSGALIKSELSIFEAIASLKRIFAAAFIFGAALFLYAM